MTGWISLHRKIRNSVVYSDPELLKLWIHCLLKATHVEYEQLVGNNKITLLPGQFVTGREALSEEYNKGAAPSIIVKPLSLWRRLKVLEKLEMLNIKTTNKYSVITITNWHEHQQNEQQMNNKRTTDEQQMNTNNNSNNRNNKNKNNSLKQVFDETSPSLILANYFHKQILKNNPNFKSPNLQKWADEFRKMQDIDNRDKKEIGELISWVQRDTFEMSNVLSPSKLRSRYDALILKMKNEPKLKSKQATSPTSTNAGAYKEFVLDLEE